MNNNLFKTVLTLELVFLVLGATILQEFGIFFKLAFALIVLSILILPHEVVIDQAALNLACLYILFAIILTISMIYNSNFNNFAYDVIKSQVLNSLIIVVSFLAVQKVNLSSTFKIVYIVFMIEVAYAVIIERGQIDGRLEGLSGGILPFGHNLVFSLLFTVFYTFKISKFNYVNQFFKFFLIVIILLAIVGNGTRSIFLGLFIVILFGETILFFTYKNMLHLKIPLSKFKKNRKKIIFSSCFILIFIMLSPALLEKVQSIFNPSTSASNMSKLMSFWVSIVMFIESPLIGVGLGSFNEFKLDVEFTNLSSSIFETVGSPHNMYLGYLGETGILGAFFYILVSAYVLVKYRNHYNDERSNVILKILIYFVFVYQIDSFFHNFYAQNFIIVVQGLILGIMHNDKKHVD
jgi:O-antigen ligase